MKLPLQDYSCDDKIYQYDVSAWLYMAVIIQKDSVTFQYYNMQ